MSQPSTEHVDLLRAPLRERPEAAAFELGGESLTFGQLDARARQWAAALAALGVERGDRVAAILETSLQLPVALLGCYYAGAVHVPVNTRYGAVEAGHILRDSGARVVLVDRPDKLELVRELASELSALEHIVTLGGLAPGDGEESFEARLEAAPEGRAPVEVHDEDLAMFIYTSGTTGRSKGVAHTYRSVVSGIDALTRLWRWEPEDRLVLALPLFHVHGLGIGVHGVLLRGCVAELHPRFEARRVIEAMGAGGTIFMGVPTMYTRLVRALDEEPALGDAMAGARLYTSGSAALSADLFEAFATHTGHRILERYGMSETMLTVSNPYEPARRKPGTIGFPVPGCEVRVVDDELDTCEPGQVGQIVVRGPTLMREYWGMEQATEEAFERGWFLTGDAARYDEDGYIVHVGRRSVDILKSGGYKISAREIEEVLARHPDVEEVAVVGLPDEEWGQLIAAAVVPGPGAPERGEGGWLGELGGVLEGALADYKRPRRVVVLEELPRNALGKIQKHRILERITSGEDQSA